MTKIEWTEATWNPIVGCSREVGGSMSEEKSRIRRVWLPAFGYGVLMLVLSFLYYWALHDLEFGIDRSITVGVWAFSGFAAGRLA